MLAIGHKSGSIIILLLPSFGENSNKQLKQTIQETAHENRAVTCMDWSADGRTLFSGDIGGKLISTTVDFTSDSFNSSLACELQAAILQVTSDKYVAICTKKAYKVVDPSSDYRVLLEGKVEQPEGESIAQRYGRMFTY
ncbi:tectonin beta-propeller repeat-containing protein 2-like isoform 2 [Aphelenchoides avenae]|nr:tectonin beta-propeller repeat-containing protein 2-like isoform 2 [Aphelenchus avenae]